MTYFQHIKRTAVLAIILFFAVTVSTIILFKVKTTHNNKHISMPKKVGAPPTLWRTHSIQEGDTLSKILSQWKIDDRQVALLLKQSLANQHLNHLSIGHTLSVKINDNAIINLKYPINSTQTLLVNNKNRKYSCKIINTPMTQRHLMSTGTITSTLSEAANTAHLSPGLYKQLIDIFAGTVDFNTSIQPGDQFRILYDEYYLNNKKHHSGDILIAELTNKNHTYTAIQFKHGHEGGYYTPKGDAIQPKYLKYPIQFTRISSPFSLHRMDPIQHKIAPHLGTDLAAPTGTPIHSIGNGKVIFKGWSHGFGKTVVIQYNHHLRGLYAHMDRFVAPLPQYVHKGELIGYVGQTGWATGPHLHLGIYIDGKAVDPMKFTTPKANPITTSEIPTFMREKNHLMTELNRPQ
ncbi:MAG: hypothetical protein CL816_03160 [Coxiellaceae bacterium]|nr:hypothetical protein [Coxiellaceae bacterium]|tara:strand:+ start:1392 stop:2606 length:1215 start_codon:yes stop_codon:yes gene_type:complete